MFARSCCRCVARARLQSRPTQLSVARAQARQYTTSPGAAPTQATSKAGMLVPFVTELDKLAPSIDLQGDQIQVLKTPSDFYETLKVRNMAISPLRSMPRPDFS